MSITYRVAWQDWVGDEKNRYYPDKEDALKFLDELEQSDIAFHAYIEVISYEKSRL